MQSSLRNARESAMVLPPEVNLTACRTVDCMTCSGCAPGGLSPLPPCTTQLRGLCTPIQQLARSPQAVWCQWLPNACLARGTKYVLDCLAAAEFQHTRVQHPGTVHHLAHTRFPWYFPLFVVRESPENPKAGCIPMRSRAAACSTAELAKPVASAHAPLAMHVAAAPAMCGDATARRQEAEAASTSRGVRMTQLPAVMHHACCDKTF
jgi:hypothetical protein